MRPRSFFACSIAILLSLAPSQLAKAQDQANPKPKSRPNSSAQGPERQMHAADAVVVTCDIDCLVSVDGGTQHRVSAYEATRIPASSGEHLVTAFTLDRKFTTSQTVETGARRETEDAQEQAEESSNGNSKMSSKHTTRDSRVRNETQRVILIKLKALVAAHGDAARVLNSIVGNWSHTNESSQQERGKWIIYKRSGKSEQGDNGATNTKLRVKWLLQLRRDTNSSGALIGEAYRVISESLVPPTDEDRQVYTGFWDGEQFRQVTNKRHHYTVRVVADDSGALHMSLKWTGCSGDCTSKERTLDSDFEGTLDLRNQNQIAFSCNCEPPLKIFDRE
jgi:hypothetical protein